MNEVIISIVLSVQGSDWSESRLRQRNNQNKGSAEMNDWLMCTEPVKVGRSDLGEKIDGSGGLAEGTS